MTLFWQKRGQQKEERSNKDNEEEFTSSEGGGTSCRISESGSNPNAANVQTV